jgi:hypothetical protein
LRNPGSDGERFHAKAGYRPAAIFGLWSTVLFAGIVAATIEKAFIGGSDAGRRSLPRRWQAAPCLRWRRTP